MITRFESKGERLVLVSGLVVDGQTTPSIGYEKASETSSGPRVVAILPANRKPTDADLSAIRSYVVRLFIYFRVFAAPACSVLNVESNCVKCD